jgi:hypothetical protein
VRLKLCIAGLLFLTSIAFQSCFITLDAFVSDEGIVMVAADDVANGKLLYQDCNVPLTPAVYLLQALAFKIFGSSFLVSRALICIVYASCVVMVFALALSYLPLRKAAFAGALAIPLQVWMWPHAHYFSYNMLAILLCLVAIRLAWQIESSPHRRRSAFFFGMALAAALWTKLNLPVAVGAGVLLYWLSGWLRSALDLPRTRTRGFSDLLGEGLATLAGIVIASLPMLAYLAINGILDDTIDSVVAIFGIYGDSPTGLFPSLLPPLAQIDAVRLSPDLVLPGMLVNGMQGLAARPEYQVLRLYSGWVDLGVRVLYFTPVVLYLAVIFVLIRRFVKRIWTEADEAAWLTLVTGLLLYSTILSFPALHYITPILLPLVGLATYALHRAQRASRPGLRRVASGVGYATTASYLVLSLVSLGVYVGIPREPVHTQRGTLWVNLATARIWNDILRYTDEELGEDDRVFAVPYFPLYYFMSGQEHPTRYVALGPGLPGVEAEDEIIFQLERDNVRYVLNGVGIGYAGLEGFENSYPRLHEYLTTRFEVDREFIGFFAPYAEFRKRIE